MRFFNEFVETIKTRNNLPHWQQDGATFFVTYRLNDSIPREQMDKWFSEKEKWLLANPKPWDEETEAEYHGRFSVEVDRMMDAGHGACVLRDRQHADVVKQEFGNHDGERYMLHSWVVMPNHVHILFSLDVGNRLEKVVGGWKRTSSRRINQATGQQGALWQKDYFDRMIRDWDHLFRVARYIRRNPVKGGLGEGEFLLYEAEWVRKMLG